MFFFFITFPVIYLSVHGLLSSLFIHYHHLSFFLSFFSPEMFFCPIYFPCCCNYSLFTIVLSCVFVSLSLILLCMFFLFLLNPFPVFIQSLFLFIILYFLFCLLSSSYIFSSVFLFFPFLLFSPAAQVQMVPVWPWTAKTLTSGNADKHTHPPNHTHPHLPQPLHTQRSCAAKHTSTWVHIFLFR